MASWLSVTDFLDDATASPTTLERTLANTSSHTLTPAQKLPSKVLLDIPNAGHLEGGTDKDVRTHSTHTCSHWTRTRALTTGCGLCLGNAVAGRHRARAPLLAREQAVRAVRASSYDPATRALTAPRPQRRDRPDPPAGVLAHGPQRALRLARVGAPAEPRGRRWRVLRRRDAVAGPVSLLLLLPYLPSDFPDVH